MGSGFIKGSCGTEAFMDKQNIPFRSSLIAPTHHCLFMSFHCSGPFQCKNEGQGWVYKK